MDLKLSDVPDFSAVLPQILPVERHAGITQGMTLPQQEEYLEAFYKDHDVVWGMCSEDGQNLKYFPIKGSIVLMSAATGQPNILADDRQPQMTAVLCSTDVGRRAQLFAGDIIG